MPRIRSIKPSFFSDAKIKNLSDSCALFFIGLWCFCDDEGKIENNPQQLALLMPKFRRENIGPWMSRLIADGFLEVGSGTAWVRVTNWSHQRINRPIPVKVKSEDIQWVNGTQTLPKHESSVSKQRKDRIGKDRNIYIYVQQAERVYQNEYPRKEGKTPGLKKLVKDLKSDKDVQDFELAVKNYSAKVRGNDKKFIKTFKTFVSEWRDWVDLEISSKVKFTPVDEELKNDE